MASISKMPYKKKHTCDHCNKRGEWYEGWERWGSMMTEEYGHMVITCSDKCRTELGNPETAFKKKYGRSAGSRYYK